MVLSYVYADGHGILIGDVTISGDNGNGAEYSDPVWERTKEVMIKNGIKAD